MFYAKKKRKDTKNGERKSFWEGKYFCGRAQGKGGNCLGQGNVWFVYVEKNKNEKKTWISRAPDRVRQRRQSSLSIGTYSWVFTDFSFLRRGTRFFWRTCVEPWSLLRVFLLVMGVDENSGNSSPQLQNMKRKYDMKSLWLMWLWHLFCDNLGRKIRKLCIHFVRPLFFTLWSVFDVMFTKTPPKEW